METVERELDCDLWTETLARIAGERDAAMLVVGTRGRGGSGGLRVGRVPVQLLDHRPCPLVIVAH